MTGVYELVSCLLWAVYIAFLILEGPRLRGEGAQRAWGRLCGRTAIFVAAQAVLMAVPSTSEGGPSMILSLNYYPGYCFGRVAAPDAFVQRYQCKRIPGLTWTIHGLWNHDRFDSGYGGRTNELEAKFKESVPAELRERMSEEWRSVTASDNLDFWLYEFGKHQGSLAVNPELDSMPKYFGKTLRLASAIPMSEWLSGEGIVPNDHELYSGRQLRTAIAKYHGKKPRLTCKYYGRHVLTEVGVCFDRNFKALDCRGGRNSCPATGILIPGPV